MIRLKDIKLIHLSGGASLGIFSILLLALLLPIATSEVNAESNLADNSAMQVGLIATPVVAIGIDQPEINFEFQPKKDGEFKTNATTVTVSTNQIDGYKILLSTENGKLTNFVTGESVNSITSNNISISDISMNSWGYNITPGIVSPSDQTTYNAIPVDATVIQDVTGEVIDPRNDQFTLSFGTKIDTSLPAGNYSSKVVVSAVANPIKITNMMQLTYMQDMTAEFCKNTRGTDGNTTVTVGHEPTKRLIDVRDGKKYWVAKLADQNCWMTQNLALDIPATGLKAADTDITTDWNQSSQYPPIATYNNLTLNVVDGDRKNGVKSWNLGEYILVDPESQQKCEPIYNMTELNNCHRLRKVDSNSTYDAHYLIGNYYQWNAANASSGIDPTAASIPNVPNSICPKNWQLPYSEIIPGSQDRKPLLTKDKSFAYLLTKYGWTEFPTNLGSGWGTTDPNSSGRLLAEAPLYLIASGDIGLQAFYNIGHEHTMWSKTIGMTNSWTFALRNTSPNNFTPVSGAENFFGISVRCVAR